MSHGLWALRDMSSFSVRNILNLKEPRMQANNTSNAMNLSVYQTDNASFEPRSKLDMGLHLAQKAQDICKFVQRYDKTFRFQNACWVTWLNALKCSFHWRVVVFVINSKFCLTFLVGSWIGWLWFFLHTLNFKFISTFYCLLEFCTVQFYLKKYLFIRTATAGLYFLSCSANCRSCNLY